MAKSSKESLPFEPRKNKKKKQDKQSTTNPQATTKSKPTQKNPKNRDNTSVSAIPDAVSKRMARRMVFLSGIPTVMGIASFFVFYWLLSQKLIEFPPYLVLIVTAGLFGLGFVGLSYSVFSASWDEDRDGGLVGFNEFKLNLERTISAWKNRGKEVS
ncbi:conserved hypothetical protein [Hyella patelloides LEGE 07179]|uniref:DUF3464 family protein n=1 Tax=Hyella patelloides LEGE 07179 TaxID=945734 RepID=A0A563VMZ8_9CYAN|nr:PAM68 family protein [Hyella patelloides]VEP12798.1 conserved hypothetical protein [Hyella patelloides LEGE 07179]